MTALVIKGFDDLPKILIFPSPYLAFSTHLANEFSAFPSISHESQLFCFFLICLGKGETKKVHVLGEKIISFKGKISWAILCFVDLTREV